MGSFVFSADDYIFNLPWSRPDLFRLSLLYRSWSERLDSIELRAKLFGDFWSSGRDGATTCQIWFESTTKFSEISQAKANAYKEALINLFRDSINEYRLFVEIALVDQGAVSRISGSILDAEREAIATNQDGLDSLVVLDVFKTYSLHKHGQLVFYETANESRTISGESFFVRPSNYVGRMIFEAAKGRVYLPPISLSDVIKTI